MKRSCVLLLLLVLSPWVWAEAAGLVGKWRTIDDETGKAKSIVEIFKDGDTFRGKISELLPPEDPAKLCTSCEGDKKDKPVVGMEIMWDMKESEPGKEWSSGHIMDPKNGKTYRCRLQLKDGGDKLNVRGYLGISLFGRSQDWERVK